VGIELGWTPDRHREWLTRLLEAEPLAPYDNQCRPWCCDAATCGSRSSNRSWCAGGRSMAIRRVT
jgi:hypothetical protein